MQLGRDGREPAAGPEGRGNSVCSGPGFDLVSDRSRCLAVIFLSRSKRGPLSERQERDLERCAHGGGSQLLTFIAVYYSTQRWSWALESSRFLARLGAERPRSWPSCMAFWVSRAGE